MGLNKNSPLTGRPAAYRWPGLEELIEKIDTATLEAAAIRLASSIIPHTREEELSLARVEAIRREKEYAGGGEENSEENNSSIEIDFDTLRFDLGNEPAHTTIDFGKITDETSLALLTTNDFVVFNKIKKILFGAAGAAAQERGWDIVDLKLNSTGSALYFITAQLPVGELKKILNKY